MLIFTNGHKNSIKNLLKLIDKFCNASGQMLNPAKSKVFFSDKISGVRRTVILDVTKFKQDKFPAIYLGAPIFPGRSKIIYFKHLEEVVKGKISGWAKHFLSMSGRATLISSVLASVSIHTLSILPVPKVVLKGIERMMCNFLWDRGSTTKHHWVTWEAICKPKDEGGLGLRLLSDVKKCLLSKLAWRFMQNKSIWAKFARSKYLYSSYTSTIWTALKPYIRRLRRDSCWEIGKGDIQLSHFCEWINVKLPKEASDWTIKDVVNNCEIRNMFLGMLEGVIRGVIDSFQLSNKPDVLLWRGAESGVFSTKACYEKIRVALPKSLMFKHLWHPWLPPKISTFVWRLWHKALPTDDNLPRLGFALVSKCWCCKSSKEEETEHMFLHSDLASPVWNFLALMFDKPIPRSMSHLQQEWFVDFKRTDFMSCLSLCLSACTLWRISA
ncbi:hypothetical protein QQ045_024031 [Rhodiola kirilowii]